MHSTEFSELGKGTHYIKTVDVLIIDDNLAVNEALTWFLGLKNYSVISIDNGEEAFTLLNEVRPAVILLDLMMPTMDGFAFRKKQQTIPHLATIPTIIISACCTKMKLAEQYGNNFLLKKPIDPETLFTYLEKFIQQ